VISCGPDGPFAAWAEGWMKPARYAGSNVPDLDLRIDQVLQAWIAPVPDGWQRTSDARLHRPAVRYLRTHRDGTPKPGSEHELEQQILRPDLPAIRARCYENAIVDGINALPLARDPAGGRRGNVEADLLLLTREATGYRQWLIEAKTQSNNAWFGVIENLRQLKLFQLSTAAQHVMPTRHPELSEPIPVTAIVLAPVNFYTATGAKKNATAPAAALINRLRAVAKIDIRLAVWEPAAQTIRSLRVAP
jgi:hypothetical protein